MKTQNTMIIFLIIESALIVFGLLTKKDIWVGMTCYWIVQLMKNICDYIEIRRKDRHDR